MVIDVCEMNYYNKLVLIITEGTHRWEVEYGKTYLVRIVNAIMSSDLFLGVAQHNLTVVGMDGNYIKPIETSYIVISAGQTMDVLLKANQSLGHYYMEARAYISEDPETHGFEFDPQNATAILQYKGNYSFPSSPLFPTDLPSYFQIPIAFNFTNKLRSLATNEYPVNVPTNITTKMFITVSFSVLLCSRNNSCDIHGATSMNNISWVNPEIDILQAYYRSGFFFFFF